MPAPLPRTLLPVRDPRDADRPETPADIELRSRALDAALGFTADPPAIAAWARRRRQLLEEAHRGR